MQKNKKPFIVFTLSKHGSAIKDKFIKNSCNRAGNTVSSFIINICNEMNVRNSDKSKRKLWEFLTFTTKPHLKNSETLKHEEAFDLEIQIYKLNQSLAAAIPIKQKKKLLKKLKNAQKRLLEIKNYS